MKVKFRFDKDALKEFLVDHVEKFVFSGIVLCFLALVASAIWVKPYEKKPEDLEESARRADEHMTNLPTDSDRQTTPFAQMIEDTQPPREDGYRHAVAWNPRLVNPMDLRDEPPVMLVRDLQASSGNGAFRMRVTPEPGAAGAGRRRLNAQSMEGTQGQRWVVITGLVPDREQVEAFEEFFRDRIKPTPEPDVPDYIYYRVERAEVDPYADTTDPEQLAWTPLNLRKALTTAQESWTGTSPEVVDERFLHPRLVFPLGPKVEQQPSPGAMWGGGEMGLLEGGMPGGMMSGGAMSAGQVRGPWGEEVAHPPEIPLKQQGGVEGMEGPMPSESESPTAPRRPDEPDADLPMPGGEMGIPGGEMGFPGGAARSRRFHRGGMEGEGMMGYPRGAPGMNELGAEGMGMMEQAPDFLLFRFFDYTVESGKSYRYRVRLMLANPNYGLPAKFLADPALAEKRWVEKDRWSEPTPVITVPRDTHLLAGGVHTRIRDTDDPSGTVAVVKWLEDTGEEVHKDFRVVRGQQLDFPETVIRDPKRNRRNEEPEAEGLLGRRAVEEEPEEPEKIDFMTDMLALDLIGGTRLPGRDRSMTEPGKFLVMDYDGALVVLSEAEDKKEYEQLSSEPEPEEPEMEMPGMPEEGMMEDMMLLEGGGPQPRGRRRPSRGGGSPMESP